MEKNGMARAIEFFVKNRSKAQNQMLSDVGLAVARSMMGGKKLDSPHEHPIYSSEVF